MVGAAASWRSSERHPQISVVVTVTVDSIGACCGIGGKRATGFLICPQDRIQASDRPEIRLIFPKCLTTFGLRWRQTLRRGQPPDRPDIHGHNAAGVRIETNIELAVTRLGRCARGRIEILIARNARRCRIWPAEAGSAATAGTRQQFDRHMNAFASRRVRDKYQYVLLGVIGLRTAGSVIGVIASLTWLI